MPSPLIRFRITLSLFILALLLSGLTAFPLLTELRLLCQTIGVGSATSPQSHTGLAFWLLTVRCGLEDVYAKYPWIAYGTDWLAFAHIVLAVFFIGPLVNPVRNSWVLWAGLIACVGVLPLAFICGPLRGIPFYWRLIDCSFGVVGVVPLVYCLWLTRRLAEGRQTCA